MSRGFAHFKHSHEFKLLLVVLGMVACLTVLTPGFATLQNLVDLLGASAFTGILAVGLLVVLITGGIDLSFAATASITQYMALTVANRYGVGWASTFAIALGVGALLGIANGVLINKLRTSAMIITIATLNVFFGILLTVTHGADIFSLPEWFGDGVEIVLYRDAAGSPYAINFQMLCLFATVALTWLLLNKTNIGRQIYAFGGNADAAQVVGGRDTHDCLRSSMASSRAVTKIPTSHPNRNRLTTHRPVEPSPDAWRSGSRTSAWSC